MYKIVYGPELIRSIQFVYDFAPWFSIQYPTGDIVILIRICMKQFTTKSCSVTYTHMAQQPNMDGRTHDPRPVKYVMFIHHVYMIYV